MVQSSNKRIAINSLLLYVRMLFSMLITLYISRIVIHVLGIEDFGIYSLVAGVIIMFGFFNSAMAAATQRFLTMELGRGDIEKLKHIFNASITIHVIIAGIVLLLAETVGLWMLNSYLNIPNDRIIAANWVYQFSIFSFILSIISVPYNASIIANEKMGIFAFIGIFEVILKLIAVLLLSKFNFDKLIVYSLLLFTVALIIRIVYGLYCARTFNECKNNKLIYDKVILGEMGRFAGWNLFGVAAGVGYNQGVNILLNIFYGTTINAARGIAFQVQGAVTNLVTNFQIAAAPVITKQYAQSNLKESVKLVFSTAKFSFILLLFFVIPLLIETKYVLTIWLITVPAYTVIFTQLILIEILINSLSGPLQILVQATGKIKKYQILVSGILIMNFPTSYLFLKIGYKPEVTIFISIFYSLIALFLRLKVLKTVIDFPIKSFFISVVLRCLLVLTLVITIVYLVDLPVADEILDLLKFFLVSSTAIIFVSFFIGLESNDRLFVLKKINNIITKVN